MAEFRFPKRVRLLRACDFERVFAARSSAGDAWVTLYGAGNDVGHARLGLTVSKRVGTAVTRNRWKRLLREAFRLSQDQLPPLDLVCVARATSPPELGHLTQALPALALRIEKRLKRDAASPAKDTP